MRRRSGRVALQTLWILIAAAALFGAVTALGLAWQRTMRLRHFEQLSDRDARFRSLLEQTQEAVAVGVGGKVAYANPGVRPDVRLLAAARRHAHLDLLRAGLARAGRRDRAAPHPGPRHGGAVRGRRAARGRHDLRRGGPRQPDDVRGKVGLAGDPARHHRPQAHGGGAAGLRGALPPSLRAQPRRRVPLDRRRADARVQPRLRPDDGLRVAGGGARPAGGRLPRGRPRPRGLPRAAAQGREPRQPRDEAAPQGRQPPLGDRERLAAARGKRDRRGHPRNPLRHDRAPEARGAAAPVPEDGGDRTAGRRHRARLQQHPHRRLGLHGAPHRSARRRETLAARARRRSGRPAPARPR